MSNKYLEKIAMNASVKNLIAGIPTAGKAEAAALKGRAKKLVSRDIGKHIPTGGISSLTNKINPKTY